MSDRPGSADSSGPLRRYVLISVVRDEEAFFPRTLDSVVRQTVPPAAWCVVDDGSRDGTPAILARAAGEHRWITVLTQPRREARVAGEAAGRGFNLALPGAWEHRPEAVGMLDGDTELPPDYYAVLLRALEREPELGIVGGQAVEPHADGSWGRVRIPAYHVHGATKFYRRACLEAIGKQVVGTGWDTADIVRARLAGWSTRTLPDLEFRHLRVSGTALGRRRGPYNRGRAAYLTGYHPLFAGLRAVRNMFRPPYLSGGLYFLQGFLSGYRQRAPRVLTPGEIRRFRREQLRALTGRSSWWR